ncbi:serine/threonine-protein kinase [Paraglaciecola polaris]|uniref:Serine/threonine protein kinase, bacterial n=2 Tax=Paraglaciecola polaris TaxID=222814 RepID=K6YIK2_9ALTE|nr:serine/threonine-protein kinase [Paraglaciecola polaris]GAC32569.1 serine/threonine protein kinase, bacterial [Paraglaciecola polaris LMG 21857]|tara:strand:+ start:10965 stop:13688 length:2724 start_codon:yes stop_codon:yes gene_type:complete
MTNDDWQEVQRIFHLAVTLSDTQRAAFLNISCHNDPALRHEIETLIKHSTLSEEIDSIIDHAAHAVLCQPQQKIGDIVDRYRITGVIGQGGMGDIYLAERADEHYTQQVAIKISRNILTNSELAARFKTERQILANLEHANIARLLDGGTTSSNKPYLVMEYIEGTPIDEYCQQHALNLRQRLHLFQKVCDAVQYAHQHLVIHCDLKPSNILISPQGEAKLLDFGISTLLDAPNTSEDADHISRLLTLHYSSPEQICGDTLSTRTDIYSLGAVLYKLLTSRLPFEHVDNNITNAIVKFTPEPPSLILRDSKAPVPRDKTTHWAIQAKDVAGDLDAILLKALHNRASQRYKDVGQFSNDIERYLGHWPIEAHRNAWYIRGKKFFRRNRLSSTLTALFLIAVSTGSTAILMQSQRIALERDIAEQERGKAVAITGFLHNMFFAIEPDKAQGKVITVREILDKASENLDQGTDHALQEQPLVEAAVRRTIGDIYFRIGVILPAIAHLEKALLIHRQQQGDDTERYRVLRALANSYNRADKFDLQRPVLEEAVSLAKHLFGEKSENTLGVMSNLAGLYNDTGHSLLAIDLHNEIYRKSLLALGESNIVTVLAITSLGADYFALGDYQKAEHYFSQGLAACTAAFGENHPLTLYNLAGVSYVLERMGFYQRALAPTTERLKRISQVLGEHHQDTLDAKLSRGRIYVGLGQYPPAEQLFNEILLALPAVTGDEHGLRYETEFALAKLYLRTERANQAVQLAQRTLTNANELWGVSHYKALLGAQILADALTINNQAQDALILYQNILDARQKSIDKERLQNKLLSVDNLHIKYVEAYQAHIGLAKAYLRIDERALGAENLRHAMLISKAHSGMPHPELPWILSSLLSHYEDMGNQVQASEIRHNLAALDVKAR